MQNYHNNIIELFNCYREYLYDENSIVYELPVYEYLIIKEKIIYESNTEDINYLTVLNKEIKGLYQNFIELQKKGFCRYYITYFKSENECVDLLGGENGILSLGFNLLLTLFIEELRNARNYMKLLLDKMIFVGNLSESSLDYLIDEDVGIDLNSTLKYRINAFNFEETHYRLNMIFLNIIVQYIDKERNITFNTIEDSFNNKHFNYVFLIIIYIVFFYWIPMVRSLDMEIYKTKKMLSIIPLQILTSHPNIRELLNISKKTE